MKRELIHDPILLAVVSDNATADDLPVVQDLLDTLMSHKDTCVGMAANMIGERKRVIVFLDESGKTPTYTVMPNPRIIKKSGPYSAEEACLSLLGAPRKCMRYKKVAVQYQTTAMQLCIKTFTGWTAQIIQHEIDHCNGILI